MQVPLQAPGRQYQVLRTEIDAAMRAVLDGGWYVLGPAVAGFERAFADYCDAPHCVGVANGTDALEIALRAVGVGPGDEVVTVANAGGYTTSACLAIGAVPVYVDIASETLTLDLEMAVAAVGDRTAAIVATHLYGWAVDVPSLRVALRVAGYEEVPVVEDCAQAHGARLAGRPIGSFGEAACFSFYPTKNLGALGDGGAVLAMSADVAERARHLRQYGWSEKYLPDIPHGRNSRLDELQAAVLSASLPELDRWNDARRRIVAAYSEAARAGTRMAMVHPVESERFVAHLAVARSHERDAMRAELESIGVATAIHYPSLDVEATFMGDVLHRVIDLEVTIRARQEIFSLPCFPTITANELSYVCEHLQRITAG